MRIEIRVVPNSKKATISKKGSYLKVHLKNPPENNRANHELLMFLADFFGCDVSFVSGLSSKRKILNLALSEEDFLKKLDTLQTRLE